MNAKFFNFLKSALAQTTTCTALGRYWIVEIVATYVNFHVRTENTKAVLYQVCKTSKCSDPTEIFPQNITNIPCKY